MLVADEERQATIIVPDDQLSLAIGREGMNARLAARLTGWRIDIKSETTYATEEADAIDQDPSSGQARCAAVLRNSRRCPNAAVPGTRFCAIPAHTAMSALETSLARALSPEEIQEAVTDEGMARISDLAGVAAAPADGEGA